MNKRLIAIGLAIVMILSLAIPTSAKFLNEESETSVMPEALRRLEAQLGENYEDDQMPHSFIIELEDDASLAPEVRGQEKAFRAVGATQDSIVDRMEQREVQQQTMKAQIERQIPQRKSQERSLPGEKFVARSFKVLTNGFTMQLTLEEARAVAEIPGVKAVYLDSKITRPDTQSGETPQMYNSGGMIYAPISRAAGYDGTGRVVAILDSGADVTHPDLRISDPSKAKYDETKINALIRKHLLKGKFYTDKVPYGYNYFDHDFNLKDTNEGTGMHGMHIAGTIAGNQEETDEAGELLMKGIVPEAQLLVMRVFGEHIPTTNTSAYIEAIDDAILLGADSINMSLGSIGGAEESLPLTTLEVIDRAQAAGVAVVIAAGNENFFANASGILPKTENPDWSVVGSPSIASQSLSVASFENSRVYEQNYVKIFDGEKDLFYSAKAMDTIAEADFSGITLGEEYGVVDVGLGNTEEDYAGKDVTGKIAFVQRGAESFANKIKLAQAKGAIAVVLGNNDAAHPNYYIIMQTQTPGLIPGYSLTYASYQELKAIIARDGDEVKLTIGGPKMMDSSFAGEMSDFSSWGPTPGLKLKPEVSAPGGNIYSTFNVDNGKYGFMSGTSMATPHVAGAISAINMKLDELDIFGNRYEAAKNIIMTTADPIPVEGTDTYYSPRKQGAGLVNLEKATAGNFVTIEDADVTHSSFGKSKIEFGDGIINTVNFNLSLENFADRDVTYEVHYVLQTDATDQGRVLLAPQMIKSGELPEIRVPAKGAATLNTTVYFAAEAAAIAKDFPNGFFVDGFIFFTPKAEEDQSVEFKELSLPFLGFRGDWNKAPIIEAFVSDMDLEQGERPFWFSGQDTMTVQGQPFEERHFTHFYAESKNEAGALTKIVLGQEKPGGKFTNHIAISPNGDAVQDQIAFRMVALRNFDDFSIVVKNAQNEQVYKVDAAYFRSGLKNFHIRPNNTSPKSWHSGIWSWDGKTQTGEECPDGEYYIVISARLQDNPDKELQTLPEKRVYVDRVEPTIEVQETKVEDGKLKVRAEIRDDRSGIRVARLILGTNMDETYQSEVNGSLFTFEIPVTEDFVLEEALSQVEIQGEDWAGNVKTKGLEAHPGKILVERIHSDETSTLQLPQDKIVAVQLDDEGREIGTYENLQSLPLGRYALRFVDAPAGWDVTFEPAEILLTEEAPEVEARAIFTKVDDNDFAVVEVEILDMNAYAGEVKVYAVEYDPETDTFGRKYRIPREMNYMQNPFFKGRVPAGTYMVYAEGADERFFAMNNRQIFTLAPQEEAFLKLRVLKKANTYGWILLMSEEAYLRDAFGEDLAEDQYGQFIKNPSKYFVIYDTALGKEIIPEEGQVFLPFPPYEKELPYNEIMLGFALPEGNYDIRFTPDLERFISVPKFANINTADHFLNFGPDGNPIGVNFGKIFVLNAGEEKGSLVINTIFANPAYENNPPRVRYEVRDFNDVLVENLYDLPAGIYTVRGFSEDGFHTEKEVYEFEIFGDNKDITLDIRWFATEDEADHPAEIEIGVTGRLAFTLDVDLEIQFRGKNNGEDLTFVIPSELKQKKFLIPRGLYSFTINNLPDDVDYKLYASNVALGDKTQLAPDHFEIKEAYEWLEIELIDRTPLPEDLGEHKLIVLEMGLPLREHASYELYDFRGASYRPTDNKFMNLKQGHYYLHADAPRGYVCLTPEKDIRIPVWSNRTLMRYARVARDVTFINRIQDADGIHDIDERELGVTYEAMHRNPDGETVIFQEGEFPVGVILTIYPKRVKAPYVLKDPAKGKQVILRRNRNKPITFVYEISDADIDTRPLEYAIAKAERVLEDDGRLAVTYVDKLRMAIEEAREYLNSDYKTEEGIRVEANKLDKWASSPIEDRATLRQVNVLVQKLIHARAIQVWNMGKTNIDSLLDAVKHGEALLRQKFIGSQEIEAAIQRLEIEIERLVGKPLPLFF